MDIQELLSKKNHYYRITTHIDLNGGNLYLPAGSTLEFQGGSIVNGTVYMNSNKILPYGSVLTDLINATIVNENAYKIGQCFFDTTLNKPIWWNGTAWVDATGAVVE